ncbi:hypothetical protein M9H77_09390 [Catharanthus roseus]|uniref:Uncharacterized protein n=1 Tax=Catharanthus roseus TaxID=4058 RepID=A0ACC0C0I6_CATRO|nr:hypothetical protein M9H77_09390 [Catharanthus roseus]
MVKLYSWTKDRSILGIRYNLFQKLAGTNWKGDHAEKHGAKNKSNSAKGRWASLTSLINKNAYDAIDVLKAMMDPFVHVHKATILQESLLGLSNTPVVLSPIYLQKKLLEKISENIFEKVHLVSLICAHPSLIAEHEVFFYHKSMLEELKISPEAGVKTQFAIELVRLSKVRGEKVLIFNQLL